MHAKVYNTQNHTQGDNCGQLYFLVGFFVI